MPNEDEITRYYLHPVNCHRKSLDSSPAAVLVLRVLLHLCKESVYRDVSYSYRDVSYSYLEMSVPLTEMSVTLRDVSYS